MRTERMLYFSPNCRFTKLNWSSKELLIKAFEERVKGFYLKPAKELNEKGYGFATGVLCVTTIDFLARITTGKQRVGERFREWLKDNIKEVDNHIADKIYADFRNGLVHEGRIKNCGQFSYETCNLIWLDDKVMVVNPELLLERITEAFENYILKIREDDEVFRSFKKTLESDFQEDIEIARKMMEKS